MSMSSSSKSKYPKSHVALAIALTLAAGSLIPSAGNVEAKVTTKLDLNLSQENKIQADESYDNSFFGTGKLIMKTPTLIPFSVKDVVASYNDEKTSSDEQPLVFAIKDEKAPSEGWEKVIVKSGDSLSSIFQDLGLGITTLNDVLATHDDAKAFTRLRVGQQIDMSLSRSDEGTNLLGMKMKTGVLETLTVSQEGNSFVFNKEVIQPETRERVARGVIENSLFVSARNAGISQNVIMKMAEVFSYDVDFSRQIQPGDTFEVLYEENHVGDRVVGYGRILAARFTSRGNTYTAVNYANREGVHSYYRADGSSMKKAFIRTPVEFARISSRFNPNRRHPVLNKIRAHKGVDYAASTGTPIRATGDGQVVHVGNKGGYGRTVVLKHGQSYQTLYAHMHRYASGLKVGSSVKQGQVIGYVGMTGLATGPHLHYEFLVNGRHVDPLGVKLPAADPIPQQEKNRFMRLSNNLMTKLDNNNYEHLAMLSN